MSVIRIRSNFASLDKLSFPDVKVVHSRLSPEPGFFDSVRDAWRTQSGEFVLVNTDTGRLMILCLMFILLPWRKVRLVSVDTLLLRPRSFGERIKAVFKKLLLLRVDLFILYFKDLRGYERYYGISPRRSVYVPFKVNTWESLPSPPHPVREGSTILFSGRTLRDVPTFLEACKESGLPAVFLHQSNDVFEYHGTPLRDLKLPANVRDEVHDGKRSSWLEFISNARLVVVPIQSGTISNAGISTCLDAMALGKCVIVSEGPATRGVFSDEEVVLVPPGDPAALADAMRRLWSDDALRNTIAANGRRLALSLEGEERLLGDIVRVVATKAR
ncbi:MAG TPA: glycosyltransferase [Candidatus Polarisedimenticolaceae bacterium]|nr:glycosyltransferase [Candidatus Polarisedimenticolaceae bacterium]